ncbi:MAG TPA: hypothetical protein VHN99_06815 [Deinococcales bacterium]|nr:hypothetical protein [Deinococcales bacterium]
MNSLSAVKALIAATVGGLVGLAPLPDPPTLDAVNPFGPPGVGVRRGGISPAPGGRDRVTTLNPDGLTGTRTLTPPRVTMRVFIDLRHGKHQETEHLDAIAILAAAFPPGNRVALDDTTFLTVDALDPSVQGELYLTVLTGRVEFDLTEAAVNVTSAVLRDVHVNVHQDPALTEPPVEAVEVP